MGLKTRILTAALFTEFLIKSSPFADTNPEGM